MSERTTQPLDNAGQIDLLSSCQANGDTFRAGRIAPGLGAQAASDRQAGPTEGGGLRPAETPPSPSRERHSPPSETRVEGGQGLLARGVGGATTNGGVGMDAREVAAKLAMIRQLPTIEDIEGWSWGVGGADGLIPPRPFFPGEQFALTDRYNHLQQEPAVRARKEAFR